MGVDRCRDLRDRPHRRTRLRRVSGLVHRSRGRLPLPRRLPDSAPPHRHPRRGGHHPEPPGRSQPFARRPVRASM